MKTTTFEEEEEEAEEDDDEEGGGEEEEAEVDDDDGWTGGWAATSHDLLAKVLRWVGRKREDFPASDEIYVSRHGGSNSSWRREGRKEGRKGGRIDR